MAEFVALFCPHCGGTVNEDELDNDHGYSPAALRALPLLGSLYTCGWCGVQTCDWQHVLDCRRSIANLGGRRRTARVLDLVALRDELAG